VPAPRLSELLSCFHAMSFCPCSHFCALTAEAITSLVSACTPNTTRPLQEAARRPEQMNVCEIRGRCPPTHVRALQGGHRRCMLRYTVRE